MASSMIQRNMTQSRPYYPMNKESVCVLEKERGGWGGFRDRNINNVNEKEVGVGGSFTFPDSGSNSQLYLESVLANSAVSVTLRPLENNSTVQAIDEVIHMVSAASAVLKHDKSAQQVCHLHLILAHLNPCSMTPTSHFVQKLCFPLFLQSSLCVQLRLLFILRGWCMHFYLLIQWFGNVCQWNCYFVLQPWWVIFSSTAPLENLLLLTSSLARTLVVVD